MRLIAFVCLLTTSTTACAGEVRVAVAANFLAAETEIAAAFEQASGHHVITSAGSTGKLYAQIRQGAPFEVFLAADVARPRRLVDDGVATAAGLFVYAEGRLALWSGKAGLDPLAMLRSGGFVHLAVASPKNAPYGAAAMQVLAKLGLADAVAPNIVSGENIAQTFQFVRSGNAELGFVAASQTKGAGGSRWYVPASMHAPIAQAAVLLKAGEQNPAARAFADFLKNDTARAIIAAYGYGLPE